MSRRFDSDGSTQFLGGVAALSTTPPPLFLLQPKQRHTAEGSKGASASVTGRAPSAGSGAAGSSRAGSAGSAAWPGAPLLEDARGAGEMARSLTAVRWRERLVRMGVLALVTAAAVLLVLLAIRPPLLHVASDALAGPTLQVGWVVGVGVGAGLTAAAGLLIWGIATKWQLPDWRGPARRIMSDT